MKRCIVCNRLIAKRNTYFHVRPPRAAFTVFGQTHPEIPDGTVDRWPGGVAIYTSKPPTTEEECQRYSNHKITRIKRVSDGTIESFVAWDGESYRDPYFCRNICAQAQGDAAAAQGIRYTWRKRDDDPE